MPEPLFITTPIYYINGEPHLGHAYTTILADTVARAARLEGRRVRFTTGTDEHGLKTLQNAQAAGLAEQVYADQVSGVFQAAWERLGIRADGFIRTTAPAHRETVEKALLLLWERGEIYKGEYHGWYCLPDERFFNETDAPDGRCPLCGRSLEHVSEPDYFFRMSSHQQWLVDYILANPQFIQPESRRNEMLGFLREPLEDLCISRPRSRLEWGIPIPFDPAFTTYIWFEALLNYLTALGWGQDGEGMAFWPQAVHLLGKDILTTHAVYWPTILHALGLTPPRTLYAHGWWVTEGRKMGKSLGNTIQPLQIAREYTPDGLRYFLLREMVPGQDAEFNPERVQARCGAELANHYGNLIQRLTAMVQRYCGGRVPEPAGGGMEEALLRERFEYLPGDYLRRCADMRVQAALAGVMDALSEVNQYLERCSPWREAAMGNRAAVNTALYTAGEAARIASGLLQTALPASAPEALRRLGARPVTLARELEWGGLQPGAPVSAGEPLYPRPALRQETIP